MDEFSILQKIKIRLGQYHHTDNSIVFDNVEEDIYLNELLADAKESVINVRHYPKNFTQEQIDDYVKSIIEVTAEDLTDAAARLVEASKNEMRSMMCSKETETEGNIIDFD